jgi:protein SCO1
MPLQKTLAQRPIQVHGPQISRRRWVLAGVLSLCGGLVACDQTQPSFHSIDVTGTDIATSFRLNDQFGTARTLAEFKGKVVVMFFGFTQCPDVCPTTLSEMVEVKKLLAADGDKLQVLFVTVDPERDRPDLLKAYMASFDASFLALLPTPTELADVAKQFKVYYKKVEGKTAGSYTMDHTASSYVFDTQGRVRLYTRPGAPGGANALAQDVKQLLSE